MSAQTPARGVRRWVPTRSGLARRASSRAAGSAGAKTVNPGGRAAACGCSGVTPPGPPAGSNMNTKVPRPARPGPAATRAARQTFRTIAFGLMAEPLDALASAPPAFEAQAARRILRDHFGLDASL